MSLKAHRVNLWLGTLTGQLRIIGTGPCFEQEVCSRAELAVPIQETDLVAILTDAVPLAASAVQTKHAVTP
ncbi:hypothetical protein FRC08_017326, partial [Ceratobasidium sp. 394]